MVYNDKNVMFITGALTGGGAERVISILANGCAELGANVSIIILRERKESYGLSEKVKCYRIQTENKKIKLFSRIRQLHKILKESNADAIIPFLPIITLYTKLANVGVNKRIITSERADPYRSTFAKNLSMKDRVGNFLMRKVGLYDRSDWMVFQTPDAQAYYSETLQKKSSIIPNPLDVDTLPNRYEGEREKRIVAVGRFSEEKNFQLLIEGFSEFHKQYSEYQLTIYGEGNLRGQLESLVTEKKLEDCIELPGFTDNLPEKISNAAMYISTSNHEGISNSMLESLGMGIPTIVTDCPVGGARMFVENDKNGILIPMNNKESLVRAMVKIADDADFSQRVSVAATKIRDMLRAEAICKQWLDLI